MRCWTRSHRISRSEITRSFLQMMKKTKILMTKRQKITCETTTRMF